MAKKLLSILLAAAMLLSFCALAEEEAPEHSPAVVLYTNDVHCGIDDTIGCAGLAAYKAAYEAAGYDLALVDCGDAIQGAAVGTLSRGEYIIDIMNEVGYDVAVPGNHEFDYNVERFMELVDKAAFPYVAANFCDAEGNPVLDPYVMMELGGYTVAFVGIATPETYFKSTPTYFQDDEGNYIYSFSEGADGQNLYDSVQVAVDAAIAEGAEIVVALAHLGTDASSSPYTSSEMIEHTNGIDVVLDGHSHSVWPEEIVKNKDGEDVILSSTGTKLQYVGVLSITPTDEGVELHTRLASESIFQDEATTEFVNGIKAEYEADLATVVAHTDVDLTIVDPATLDDSGNPVRIVRSQETNLGDLCAAAYLALGEADVAFVNGGGIRKSIPAGDITYEQIIAVHPFGNALCVCYATGQEILDALEMASRALPDENGGFLQVAGLSYEINMAVDSTVVTDDHGMFVEVTGDRRVQNVMMADGTPIDPEATYKLASHNYMLQDSGDGINMFADNEYERESVMLDNQVLINYITDYLGGVVGEEYADLYGQGRITIIQ